MQIRPQQQPSGLSMNKSCHRQGIDQRILSSKQNKKQKQKQKLGRMGGGGSHNHLFLNALSSLGLSATQLEAEGKATREAVEGARLAVQVQLDDLQSSLTRIEAAMTSSIGRMEEEIGKVLSSGGASHAALTATVNEAAARVETAVTEAGGSAVEAKQAAADLRAFVETHVFPQVVLQIFFKKHAKMSVFDSVDSPNFFRSLLCRFNSKARPHERRCVLDHSQLFFYPYMNV
jgi:ribosomal protein L15